MTPHSPCDAQKDSTPSSGTPAMFLSPKITTNSLYFHSRPLRRRVFKPAQSSPISQPSTVSERVSESTQRRRVLCAANRMCKRGSCYIGVEQHSQTTLPVLFVKGRLASKSSLVGERHPETDGGFLPQMTAQLNLYIPPLCLFKYIILLKVPFQYLVFMDNNNNWNTVFHVLIIFINHL